MPTKGLEKLSYSVVKSTIDIYFRISKDLLPTPSKCHYTFNLRDVAKVFQGVLQVKYDYLTTKEYLTQLWVHEVNRIFYDRLVDDKDRGYLLG
jgi:dynein heavy chain